MERVSGLVLAGYSHQNGIGRRAHMYFQPTFSSVTVSSSSMLSRTGDPLSAWPRRSWCVPQRGPSESAPGNIEPSRVYLL